MLYRQPLAAVIDAEPTRWLVTLRAIDEVHGVRVEHAADGWHALLSGLQAAIEPPTANPIGNYLRAILGIAGMAMFDLGEFCFVQRSACRHKAAGTDGIDGSILVSSTRKRLIRDHETNTLGRSMTCVAF